MKRYVVIPALDPDAQLLELIDANRKAGNTVIVVDDGSAVSANAVLSAAAQRCKILHHGINLGKGAAIKTALRHIGDTEHERCLIGIMDADGQHKAEDLFSMFDAAERAHHALILGVRSIDRNVPWRSAAGNVLTRKIFHIQTGLSVSDTQSGLRVFSSELLPQMLQVKGERYEYEMNVLFMCAKAHVPIVEIPITTIYHDEKNSCSHFRKVSDSIRIYKQVIAFSFVSLSSFLLDYILFVLFTICFPAAGAAASNIGARILSGGYNYLMNCTCVFHHKKGIGPAMRYLALACLILLLNTVLLQIYHAWIHIPLYVSKLLTECTLFILSWIVQKHFIFVYTKRKEEGI